MQKEKNITMFGRGWEIQKKLRILMMVPVELPCPVLTKTADTVKKSVKVTWKTEPKSSYEIYLVNEEGSFELYTIQEEDETTFSPENCEKLADRDQAAVMVVRTMRRGDDYRLYGTMSSLVVKPACREK